jgi:Cysteine-rich secretory protein family
MAPRTTANAPSSTTELPSGENEMLNMVNQSRAQAGVAPLTMRQDIRSIAIQHSFDMAKAGYIYHNDSYFSSSTRSSLHAGVLGENVDMNFSVGAAEQALMNSPGHRANILDARFVYVGIGIVETSSGDYYVTQDFVQPADGWRPPAPAPAGGGSGGHGAGLASVVPVARTPHAAVAAPAAAASPAAVPAAAAPIDPTAIIGPVARSLAKGTKGAPGPSGLLLLTGLGGLLPGAGGLIRLRSHRVRIH